jgi:ATP-dependent phosphofructokinase / diphosphate-dependent phosphofructokinase
MTASRHHTIAILTGGGDVPGLNPCIKQLVLLASQRGMTVLGIRKGWEGLLAFSPDSPASRTANIQTLGPAGVRTIDRTEV